MAERIPRVCAVLGRAGAADLEILGLAMLTSERVKPVKPLVPVEKKPQDDKNNKVNVPDEWKLTHDQKEFIDLFNQDENKKQ